MKTQRVLALLHRGDGLTFGGRAILRIPGTWDEFDRIVRPMALEYTGPFKGVSWRRGVIELLVKIDSDCPARDERRARAVRKALCRIRRAGITSRPRARVKSSQERSTRDTTTRHPFARAIEDSGVPLDARERGLLWGYAGLAQLPVWFPFPGPVRARRRERRRALSLYQGTCGFLRYLAGAPHARGV